MLVTQQPLSIDRRLLSTGCYFDGYDDGSVRERDMGRRLDAADWLLTAKIKYRKGYKDMAKLVFGMMQSLDGYVDDAAGGLVMGPPDLAVHQHFADHVRGLAGILYGSSHVCADAVLG